MISKFNHIRALALARTVLETEAAAILGLISGLDEDFTQAIRVLLECKGKVIVCGMGKSGHIARKLAATFASTGTPAFFVHPAEACHGDLGMITANDVLLALSNSGETHELVNIMPLIKRLGTFSIAITGREDSRLAKLADIHLNARVEKEACPLDLAPTASTTAALGLGDALAVAVLDARGFSPEDFARSHPGGALGRRLLVHVEDIMHHGNQVPRVNTQATVYDALFEMTEKRLGMTAIVDDKSRALGIFTDGDLRRTLAKHSDLRHLNIAQVMTREPHTLSANQLATEAAAQMEKHRVNQMLVANDEGILIGALNMHDLLEAKVV
jgi:arabinose-5-phosphate isomerase